MPDTKTRYVIRFEPSVSDKRRVKWLQGDLGGITTSQVLRTAVRALYEQRRASRDLPRPTQENTQ